MATVFIFGSDIEKLVKEGKREIEISQDARISAAARDLIKEHHITVNTITPHTETHDTVPPVEKQVSEEGAHDRIEDMADTAHPESSPKNPEREATVEISEKEIEEIANRVLERLREAKNLVRLPAEKKDVNGAADDDLVICRCEEITKGEIKEAIRNGISTLNGIKRITRAGMGLCQGQTCQRLVTQILAGELGISPAEIESTTARAPVRPVRLSVFATG